MIKVIWTLNATKDLEYWKKHDIKNYKRIKLLVKNIQKTPFTGIGKPEPLEYSMTNLWSRRINHEDRLVYSIEDVITIYSCRFHYKK